MCLTEEWRTHESCINGVKSGGALTHLGKLTAALQVHMAGDGPFSADFQSCCLLSYLPV